MPYCVGILSFILVFIFLVNCAQQAWSPKCWKELENVLIHIDWLCVYAYICVCLHTYMVNIEWTLGWNTAQNSKIKVNFQFIRVCLYKFFAILETRIIKIERKLRRGWSCVNKNDKVKITGKSYLVLKLLPISSLNKYN